MQIPTFITLPFIYFNLNFFRSIKCCLLTKSNFYFPERTHFEHYEKGWKWHSYLWKSLYYVSGCYTYMIDTCTVSYKNLRWQLVFTYCWATLDPDLVGLWLSHPDLNLIHALCCLSVEALYGPSIIALSPRIVQVLLKSVELVS